MAKKKETGMMYKCCLSSCGMVHLIGGIGLAFLLVEYFRLGNLLLWGWALVAVAVLGHLTGKTECERKSSSKGEAGRVRLTRGV